MGFFSWKVEEDRPIWNKHAQLGPTPVEMLAPDGRRFTERNYEGYGDFGGMDFYALLAFLNGYGYDRDAGIKIEFSDKHTDLIYPRFVRLGSGMTYEEAGDPVMCETQGFFNWDGEYDA